MPGVLRHRRGGAFGPGPHPVQPGGAVHRQRRRADQRGEFPGGLPPHEVHLEEPLLPVEEAERADGVLGALRPYSRHAEPVPLDHHRRGKTGEGRCPGESREARPKRRLHPEARRRGGEQDDGERRPAGPEEPAPAGRAGRGGQGVSDRFERGDGAVVRVYSPPRLFGPVADIS